MGALACLLAAWKDGWMAGLAWFVLVDARLKREHRETHATLWPTHTRRPDKERTSHHTHAPSPCQPDECLPDFAERRECENTRMREAERYSVAYNAVDTVRKSRWILLSDFWFACVRLCALLRRLVRCFARLPLAIFQQ